MFRMSLLALSSLALVPTALAGPTVPMRQVAPPAEPIVGMHTIAVGTMTGAKGKLLGDLFGSTLSNPYRTEIAAKSTSYTEAVLGSFGSMFGGGTSKSTTGNAGAATKHQFTLDDGLTMDLVKLVKSGADATFSGSASFEGDDVNYTSQMDVTENGYTYKKTVLCVRRDVTVQYAWALVNKSGKELLSDDQTTTQSASACDAAVGSLPTKDAIGTSALETVMINTVNRFAPRLREYQIDLAGGKDVKAALKVSDDGDNATAACMLKAAFEAKEDATVAYDLAGMLEGLGDLEGSLAWNEKTISMKKNKYATEAIERVTARKAEIAVFEKTYGAKYKLGAFDFDSCK